MFTKQDILKLRKATQAGITDCRNALQAADGNFEQAITWLRKKGKQVAAQRAGRTIEQGAVFAKVNESNTFGVILTLGCETDFVARNSTFERLGNSLLDAALRHKPTSIVDLVSIKQGNLTLEEKIVEAIGTLAEHLSIVQYHTIHGPLVASYVHTGSRIGSLVALNHPPTSATLQAARDVAIQVVANDPIGIDTNTIDTQILEEERTIITEQLAQQGKNRAATVIEKILQGKMDKFIKQHTLLAQPFVKDNAKTVANYLKEIDPELAVTGFKRLAIAQ